MEIVSCGAVRPERILTQEQPIRSVIDAYKMFADKKAGSMQVELRP